VVDREKPGVELEVDSRDEGKYTGKNGREDDVDRRASVTKDIYIYTCIYITAFIEKINIPMSKFS